MLWFYVIAACMHYKPSHTRKLSISAGENNGTGFMYEIYSKIEMLGVCM